MTHPEFDTDLMTLVTPLVVGICMGNTGCGDGPGSDKMVDYIADIITELKRYNARTQ